MMAGARDLMEQLTGRKISTVLTVEGSVEMERETANPFIAN